MSRTLFLSARYARLILVTTLFLREK